MPDTPTKPPIMPMWHALDIADLPAMRVLWDNATDTGRALLQMLATQALVAQGQAQDLRRLHVELACAEEARREAEEALEEAEADLKAAEEELEALRAMKKRLEDML